MKHVRLSSFIPGPRTLVRLPFVYVLLRCSNWVFSGIPKGWFLVITSFAFLMAGSRVIDSLEPRVLSLCQRAFAHSSSLFASRRRLFDSFVRLVVRNPDARAMIEEILADRDRELVAWGDDLAGRAWVRACAVWALCWHLGVFKVLSLVLNLVERVFTRRA